MLRDMVSGIGGGIPSFRVGRALMALGVAAGLFLVPGCSGSGSTEAPKEIDGMTPAEYRERFDQVKTKRSPRGDRASSTGRGSSAK